LEKVAEVVDAVNEARGSSANELVSVFITIDPHRDDKKRVKAYVEEFHPAMIGLVGSEKACDDAARKYRVYHRKTGDERATKDYLIDHSIITYLIDPNGDFVTFYGKNTTAEEVSRSVLEHARDFDEGRGVAAREADRRG
jgi:protein SCO1/2